LPVTIHISGRCSKRIWQLASCVCQPLLLRYHCN
jgi:hypothetical protein